MTEEQLDALVYELTTLHRINNPRAVHRICDNARDAIIELRARLDAKPRRGRPPKVQGDLTSGV